MLGLPSVEVKIKLISSMFPEKIEFDGIRYRTKSYNKVLDLIYQETKELRTGRIKCGVSFDTHSACVPRAGVEPARVAPLVFETSASTDSAIWAGKKRVCFFTKAGAKVSKKIEMSKGFDKKLKNTWSFRR